MLYFALAPIASGTYYDPPGTYQFSFIVDAELIDNQVSPTGMTINNTDNFVNPVDTESNYPYRVVMNLNILNSGGDIIFAICKNGTPINQCLWNNPKAITMSMEIIVSLNATDVLSATYTVSTGGGFILAPGTSSSLIASSLFDTFDT